MNIMRYLFALIVFSTITSPLKAQKNLCAHRHQVNRFMGIQKADESRSDSIDVTHISLDLDFTQMNAFQISGTCEISFEALLDNVNHLALDLLEMEVSGVTMNGADLNFDYNSPLLVINFDESMNTGDGGVVNIAYAGQPQGDASGWGGFYFQNNHAFNLGVGFDADPHNYGRVWFPCFDNFVERSTFDIQVLTNNGRTAYCGGDLVEQLVVGQDSLLSRWSINQSIPSYLTSIAVANYTHIEDSFESIDNSSIPIWLAALPEDTAQVRASFINLVPCLEGFENNYGAYRWDRVGYVMVPFSSGAMEHATNIAYPAAFANGSLDYETLMAHELAHHWWGDLVTCRRQEDMWINEGMASYAESLFLEAVYGNDAYLESVLDNHKDVLLYAHERDGARLPVSGIGHEHTYGDHVYNKGAVIAHNLRKVMGDEAYFEAAKAFLDANQFSDVSSLDMQDFFQNYTLKNLGDFFNGWIFQEGFPDFILKSWSTTQIDNSTDWNLQYSISQQNHYKPSLIESQPMFIEARGFNGEYFREEVALIGQNSIGSINLPFQAKWVFLDDISHTLQASLSEEQMISDDGITNFNRAEFRLDIDTPVESPFWMRVENHWSTAESEEQENVYLSDDRFWRVLGDFPSGLISTARIRYYGNPDAGNYFDPKFFAVLTDLGIPEDSLRLFFRPLQSNVWQAHPHELGVQGNNTNYQGQIEFPLSQAGDYAWGIASDFVGVEDKTQTQLRLFPNPCGSDLNVSVNKETAFQVLNTSGQIVLSGQTSERIDVSELAIGSYFLKMGDQLLTFIKQ